MNILKHNPQYEDFAAGEVTYLRELVLDLYCQGCYINKENQYDHSCISTYEEAQHYLLKQGLLKREQCYRP